MKPYNGLANRRFQPLSHLSISNKTIHFSRSLSPQSSPTCADSVQLGASDTQDKPISADLQAVIFAWGKMPPQGKAAVLALVQAYAHLGRISLPCSLLEHLRSKGQQVGRPYLNLIRDAVYAEYPTFADNAYLYRNQKMTKGNDNE